MPTAVGRLRYGPQSPSLPRKGWWLLLECDRDWFRRYAPEAQRELPPQFVEVVDRDRVFEGRHVDDAPRLGIYRPALLEPAWRPHISIARNERPKMNLDLWNMAVQAGDLLDDEEHAIESAKYLRDKATRLQAELALVDPGKAKHIRKMQAEIDDALRVAATRDRKLHAVRAAIPKALDAWRVEAERRGLPPRLGPGSRVEFAWNECPRSSGHHWWFDVICETLLDLREVYGLRRGPRLPLHLTFAVAEDYETSR